MEELRSELTQAMSSAMGAAKSIEEAHLEGLRAKLLPMWQTLPKNEHGLVDRRSLRYAVHRYMLQTYSLAIIGLEPPMVNTSQDEVSLLTEFAPAFVRAKLEGDSIQKGFSLEDAVLLTAVVQGLAIGSNQEMLEEAYQSVGMTKDAGLSKYELNSVMINYVMRWMLSDDATALRDIETRPELVQESFEHWPLIVEYTKGRVEAFEFERTAAPRKDASSWTPLKDHFSFTDAKEIASSVTATFGGFWETECGRVKNNLAAMDRTGSGRVKLSDFHGAALNGEWRFSESKEYLRQLGALDESSRWQGPRVIVTNYMQSASNCIIYSNHYRVCCQNECESYMGDLERAIGSPFASPEAILAQVSNMTTSLEDGKPRLTTYLRKQLDQIAAANSGKVPLHGFLFAQWMHYVFPMDCPLPHKAGTVNSIAPNQAGNLLLATEEEMRANVNMDKKADKQPEISEPHTDAISQWSHEEELLAEHVHLAAPWESCVGTPLAGFTLMFVSMAVYLASGGKGLALPSTKGKDMLLPMSGKAHFL